MPHKPPTPADHPVVNPSTVDHNDDLGELTADELAAKIEQAATDAGTHVRFATTFPLDEFDPSLDGVDVITSGGTLVPADREQDVLDSAGANGVPLRKV